METMFWVFAGFAVYSYVGYPVLLFLLTLLSEKQFRQSDIRPTISIIIAAYNEEKHIARKLGNTLALDYPQEKFEVIVGSDGSTDRTEEIVLGYAQTGVRLLAFKENRGKTAIQDYCVKHTTGDILVFTDAASICNRKALLNIVRNFADQRVGAVAGKITFVHSRESLVSKSQTLYWRYEQILKRLESRTGRLVGVDGPLYAVRREAYVPLQPNIISDLMTPLLVLDKGYYAVYEEKAIADEYTTNTSREEYDTRRRLVLRGLVGLWSRARLLNPLSNGLLSWEIISHKIIRWFVGFYFLGLMVSSVFLYQKGLYLAVFIALLCFCTLALVGFLVQNSGTKRKLFAVPYYFVLVNFAALAGIIAFIRRKEIVSWKPIRS